MQFLETSIAALLVEKFVPTFFVDHALLDEARRSSADASIPFGRPDMPRLMMAGGLQSISSNASKIYLTKRS
jgi:hypothetical protein